MPDFEQVPSKTWNFLRRLIKGVFEGKVLVFRILFVLERWRWIDFIQCEILTALDSCPEKPTQVIPDEISSTACFLKENCGKMFHITFKTSGPPPFCSAR